MVLEYAGISTVTMSENFVFLIHLAVNLQSLVLERHISEVQKRPIKVLADFTLFSNLSISSIANLIL